MPEIKTTSGAKAEINVADFEDAMELKNAITRSGLQSGALGSISLGQDISALINIAAAVDSSAEVYKALWPCLARCTYKGQKITKSTFEPPEARKDFYDIVNECVKVNVSPFFESLLSLFRQFVANLPSKNPQK